MSLLVSVLLPLWGRRSEFDIFVMVIIGSGEGALDTRARAFMVTLSKIANYRRCTTSTHILVFSSHLKLSNALSWDYSYDLDFESPPPYQ